MAKASWSGTDPAKWSLNQKQKFDLLIRMVSLKMFSRVILRSPVDTGRFRANWMVAIADIPSGTLDLNDKRGRATISKVDATTSQLKAGDVITLVNNLPYGEQLEYGSSRQAPGGMVSLTVQEFKAVVAKAGLQLVTQ